MNKKVTIIPSTVSLKKAVGLNQETYKCLGIFPTVTDLRKFEFLKSTISTYKPFEIVDSIYCEAYNTCQKSKLTQLIQNSNIDVVICSSRNDIKFEYITIPIYCLDKGIVISNGNIIKLN